MKRFVIGWARFKPGKQDEFLAVAKAHIAATREEEGCLFLEINLSMDKPDTAVFAECFRDARATEIHESLPHVAVWKKRMSEILIEGRFENIFSDEVVVDVVKFD